MKHLFNKFSTIERATATPHLSEKATSSRATNIPKIAQTTSHRANSNQSFTTRKLKNKNN